MTRSPKSKTVIKSVVDPESSELFVILDKFLETTGESSLDEQSQNRLKDAIAEKKITFFIAQDEDSVLGVCSLTIGFSTYRSAPIGMMEDFYVVPEMRGRGIARQLLDSLLSDAKQKRCGSVIIGCGTDDIPMYKHFGFKVIGNMMAIDITGPLDHD